MSIETAIAAMGWNLASKQSIFKGEGTIFRAECGKFSTHWRESSELVLADLHEMKRKDAEAEVKP